MRSLSLLSLFLLAGCVSNKPNVGVTPSSGGDTTVSAPTGVVAATFTAEMERKFSAEAERISRAVGNQLVDSIRLEFQAKLDLAVKAFEQNQNANNRGLIIQNTLSLGLTFLLSLMLFLNWLLDRQEVKATTEELKTMADTLQQASNTHVTEVKELCETIQKIVSDTRKPPP